MLDGPEITAVVVGLLLTVSERTALCPQVLTARNVSEPLTNAEAKDTVTLAVPCPAVIVALVGAVHK